MQPIRKRPMAVAAVALAFVSCGPLVVPPVETDEPAGTDEPPGVCSGEVTVRGTVEDSETDAGSPGEVRVYGEHADGSHTLLASGRTDAAGAFRLSFPGTDAPLSLQARLKDGEVETGYVRTVPLSGGCESQVLVRAVPYTGLNGDTLETDIGIEQFREFIVDVMDDGRGIHKWRIEDLQGIEVIPEYRPPAGGRYAPGEFNQEELDLIERVLRDDALRVFFGGKRMRIQVDDASTPDSEKHYRYDAQRASTRIAAEDGWIIVFPTEYTGVTLAAAQSSLYRDGHRRAGAIALTVRGIRGEVREHKRRQRLQLRLNHELGHVTYATFGRGESSHTRAVERHQSLMADGGSAVEPICIAPCFADRKALRIVYEDTFPARTRVHDILGLDWRD